MHGISVYDYSVKKKGKAVTMKVRSTIELDGEVVHVDPQLLFQHVITTLVGSNSDTDLETAFSYELCTFPTCIIDNDGLLREVNKPQLADAIWKDIGGSTCIISKYFLRSFGERGYLTMTFVHCI